jgi:pimeloyl-ACP methyl ester carboxylesterase
MHDDTTQAGTETEERIFRVRLNPTDSRTWQLYGRQFRRRAHDVRALLILVPGGTYAWRYWDVPYRPELYSFVRWATRAGYAVLALDRLGIGRSDRPPADELTMPVNAYALHQVAQTVRAEWPYVVLVGHSIGSWASLLEAGTHHDVDALVLTGILHQEDNTHRASVIGNLLAPASGDPALASDPRPDGYFTTRPGARSEAFYDSRFVEPALLDIDERSKQTATSGELATLHIPRERRVSEAVNVPVLILIGECDRMFTAGQIRASTPVLIAERDYYAPDTDVEVATIPCAGHNTCLHTSAPIHHALILDWLGTRMLGRSLAKRLENWVTR